jgi:hypothetical protein
VAAVPSGPNWTPPPTIPIKKLKNSDHVDLMPSEDGQLTETCKGNKYLKIELHWTVLTNIL